MTTTFQIASPSTIPPVSTFVFVSRLVRPEWMIEVEAVAMIGGAR